MQSTLKPGTPIFVRELGNGYLVEPMRGYDHTGTADSERMVFRSLGELSAFLPTHFSPLTAPGGYTSALCKGCKYTQSIPRSIARYAWRCLGCGAQNVTDPE